MHHPTDRITHTTAFVVRGALAGTRNRSMGPPWRIDPMTHHTRSERIYHGATSRSLYNWASLAMSTKCNLQRTSIFLLTIIHWPVSVDSLVLVLLFWKIIAIDFPTSGWTIWNYIRFVLEILCTFFSFFKFFIIFYYLLIFLLLLTIYIMF